MATDGLFERGGPGQISLLNAAFEDAALVVESVGALFVFDGGSAEIVFLVLDVEALGFDGGAARVG